MGENMAESIRSGEKPKKTTDDIMDVSGEDSIGQFVEENADKVAAILAEGEKRRVRFEKAMAEGDTNYILGLVDEQKQRYRDEYNLIRQNPWRNDV